MPSSTHAHIPAILTEVMRARPASVLDVGVGFGKWGHLVREYTDVWAGRFDPKDWRVHIAGIEIFSGYINAGTRAYYDELMIGDLRTILPDLNGYDLVLAIDVLEHLERRDALEAMLKLIDLAKTAVFAVPLGERWLKANGAYARINPAEAHRSAWKASELGSLPNCKRSTIVPGLLGPVGVFVYQS